MFQSLLRRLCNCDKSTDPGPVYHMVGNPQRFLDEMLARALERARRGEYAAAVEDFKEVFIRFIPETDEVYFGWYEERGFPLKQKLRAAFAEIWAAIEEHAKTNPLWLPKVEQTRYYAGRMQDVTDHRLVSNIHSRLKSSKVGSY